MLTIRAFQVELDGDWKMIRAETVSIDGIFCYFYQGLELVDQISCADLKKQPKPIFGLSDTEKAKKRAAEERKAMGRQSSNC